jgi:hypothetical protein
MVWAWAILAVAMPADAKITPIFTMLRRVRMAAGLEFGGS